MTDEKSRKDFFGGRFFSASAAGGLPSVCLSETGQTDVDGATRRLYIQNPVGVLRRGFGVRPNEPRV